MITQLLHQAFSANSTETLPRTTLAFGVEHRAATDVGRVRASNEDRFLEDEPLGLFLVADGMGGHVAGEVAAQMAVEEVPRTLRAELEAHPEDAPELLLQRALEHTSALVLAGSKSRLEWTDMGTTLVALWICDTRAFVAHIGDSRVYLLRHEKGFSQLTTDHTLVELLVESGDLSREEANTHPMRHQITRFCGMEGEAVADVSGLELESGDLFLLCSDGVSNELSDENIALLLQEPNGAQAIVRAAVEAGGRDNATALTVRIA